SLLLRMSFCQASNAPNEKNNKLVNKPFTTASLKRLKNGITKKLANETKAIENKIVNDFIESWNRHCTRIPTIIDSSNFRNGVFFQKLEP
ncbi:MAG TPA: hypothetical protein PLT02_13195, partial [Chitinophagaceae bacterium]|nr:hypothetical protein [Chitinophagaceae bacterium]HRA12048.1 hypothetical protein [Chitinophagaceae bacterium]